MTRGSVRACVRRPLDGARGCVRVSRRSFAPRQPPPSSSRHVWCVATSVFDGVYVVRGDGVLPSQAADV